MTTQQSEFNFTVQVVIDDNDDATFTIYGPDGKVFNGPVEVTEPNSTINYTLWQSPDGMTFTHPQIDNDNKDNLTYVFSEEDSKIIFMDSDEDEETIALYLKTVLNGTIYTSQDPQIRNKTRG